MNKLIKGCKVKVKCDGIFQNEIGIVKKIKDNSCVYPIVVEFDDLNIDITFRESDLEIIEEIIPKSINAIQYKGDNIVSWSKLDSLNLKVNIKGEFFITTLCKILLNYVEELNNFTYKRVCPYKLIHEKARYRADNTHLFYIKYITIQEEIKIKNIIQTNESLKIEEGEYNFFIPDLLELCKNRGLVLLDKDTYISIDKKLATPFECKEMKVFDRIKLENEGWIVPSQFEKYFNTLK